jgi:hypothetical protein
MAQLYVLCLLHSRARKTAGFALAKRHLTFPQIWPAVPPRVDSWHQSGSGQLASNPRSMRNRRPVVR